MSAVPIIGRCKGCARMGCLDDGVCRDCLDDPRRGRRWAELSERCRQSEAFRRLVFERLTNPRAKEQFIDAYGPIRPRPSRDRELDVSHAIPPPIPPPGDPFDDLRFTASAVDDHSRAQLEEPFVLAEIENAEGALDVSRTARLAVRWNHVADRSPAARRRIGTALAQTLSVVSTDGPTVASALAVLPLPELWKRALRVLRAPDLVLFTALRCEVARRRVEFIDSFPAEMPASWVDVVTSPSFRQSSCECLDCQEVTRAP